MHAARKDIPLLSDAEFLDAVSRVQSKPGRWMIDSRDVPEVQWS